MKSLTVSLVLSLCFLIRISAQEAPKIKFEKPSDEELSMKTYPTDSTADAVILYDDGSSYVKYDLERGFMLTFERFVRIKILRQNGVEWGNFQFSLYSHNLNKEDLTHVKGTTINLENGKIVKTDLKKNAVFRERENKYRESVKFSMPAVKVGSIIDLQYTIATEMTWNLRTWKFQYKIPVKWSQYRVVYPEYFTYNHSSLGYHSLLYNKRSQSTENISYTERVDNTSNNTAGFRVPSTQAVARTITYLNQIIECAASDIPAIKEEPYLTSLDNYTSQLKSELNNTNFSKIGGSMHNYTTSWNDIAKQLADDDSFGQQLKSTGFLSDDVEKMTKGISSNETKLNIIYSFVQRSMKWDGFKSFFTDKSLKKAYADKTGNSADINLLLIAMLKKAGIDASPVLLSTRENGIIGLVHPTLSDCNYVVARATLDGKQIFLDATEPNLQAGIIPFRCLNGEGYLIQEGSSESVQLTNPKSMESSSVVLDYKDGKMTGLFKKKDTGLSAHTFRKSVKTSGGQKEYFEKLKNSSPELDYVSFNYTNLDSLSQPIVSEYRFSLKEKQDSNAGVIYLDPVVIERQKTNPFSSPTRIYPVDFGTLVTQYYNMQFDIPQGYMAEELPKEISISLPGRAGQFMYQISQMDQKINLTMVFSINKTLFLPDEYQALKNFFDLVINKQAEQVVLKKKTT
ncbi:MAG: DUF3857 and transglutaminase domain-containing protein [Bacteroidia bacterium]|nr:DUF3857 and transglutaminase domain-containing protein [Bacteroidia bacterium]